MAARAIIAGFLLLWVVSGAMGQTAPASASDQYQEKLKGIDPNRAEDHYTLGEWAYRNNLNAEALKHLQAALALNPNHLRAQILIRDVQAKVGKAPATGPATGPGKEPSAVGVAIPPEWLIGKEDIYRIRMEEIGPGEKQISIQFRNNVIDRFIRKWRGKEEFKRYEFEDFFRGRVQSDPGWAVDFIRNHNPDDTEVKDDILVGDDPNFMVVFKNKVWPIVASSCAAATCHGGGEPKGGLRLFNVSGRNERVDYTNYVILDGMVSKNRRMVDRSNPELSLLLQFMLTEDLAQFRHPSSIPAAVGRRGEPKYLLVRDWLQSLHQPPHPDYRLKYKPPMGMTIVGRGEISLPTPGSTPASTKP